MPRRYESAFRTDGYPIRSPQTTSWLRERLIRLITNRRKDACLLWESQFVRGYRQGRPVFVQGTTVRDYRAFKRRIMRMSLEQLDRLIENRDIF